MRSPLSTVWDSAESSWGKSGTALSQAEKSPGQLWVKSRKVTDSADSSWAKFGTALSQAVQITIFMVNTDIWKIMHSTQNTEIYILKSWIVFVQRERAACCWSEVINVSFSCMHETPSLEYSALPPENNVVTSVVNSGAWTRTQWHNSVVVQYCCEETTGRNKKYSG